MLTFYALEHGFLKDVNELILQEKLAAENIVKSQFDLSFIIRARKSVRLSQYVEKQKNPPR